MSRNSICLLSLVAWVATVQAGPTAPGDQYLLHLKRSPEAKWTYGLCFADSSVYFHDQADSARKFISLAEVQRLERDTRMDALLGVGIGIGLALGGTMASYYLGGGNAPGNMWDRKGAHILAGIGLGVLGSLVGAVVGESFGQEELYRWRNPGLHASRRQGYACGADNRVDSLPRAGASAQAADRDSAVRNSGPGFGGASHHLGERGGSRQSMSPEGRGAGTGPPQARSEVAAPPPEGYRDLKPEIDKQYRADSAYFRGVRKLRLLVMAGGTLIQFEDAMPNTEYFRIAATRMLSAHKKSLTSVTLGFSRISTMEETGSRYILELLGGKERHLGARWWLHAQGGIRTLYPFQIGEDLPYLPVLLAGVNIGFSWKWERSLLYLESTSYNSMGYLGLRAGAGCDF